VSQPPRARRATPPPRATQGFRERWFKHRVAALLLILLGALTWRAVIRARENRPVDWQVPHHVTICPLVAPGTDAAALAERLEEAPPLLEAWMSAQREYWLGAPGKPLAFHVAPPVTALRPPPWLPSAEDSWWTRFRETSRFLDYLEESAASFPPREGDDTRIWLYVYRNDDRGAWKDRLSVGTKRGRVGVVFASDDPDDWGNVLCVILHETMHALGAPDHRLGDDTIAFPQGYADPSATPPLPQKQAEIMALGIPITETEELRVDGLEDVVMGLWTAQAIGWR
jgi:hypothetical protein